MYKDIKKTSDQQMGKVPDVRSPERRLQQVLTEIRCVETRYVSIVAGKCHVGRQHICQY